ncbi:MAG: hypothetical protein ACPHGV_00715 [Synechococcus sp.]
MPVVRSAHPLDLLDALRRWLPGASRWQRNPMALRPEASEDWLLEPTTRDEAVQLFPHLDPDSAVLHYQRLKLQLRERDGRGF